MTMPGQGFTIYVPAPTISFGGAGAFSIEVPAPLIVFNAAGGFSTSVPATELVFTGISGTGILRIQVPLATLTFTGLSEGTLQIVVPHPIVRFGIPGSIGSFQINVPPPSIVFQTIDLQGEFSISVPPSRLAFSGLTGTVGAFSIYPYPPKISFTGYIKLEGGFSITAPLPLLVFGGYSLGVATKVFRGVSINISHFGISEYTDFPFNSFANFNGKLLAAGGIIQKGIWSIEGKKDNGMPINIRIRTGSHDFFRGIMRRIRDTWITFRSNGPILFRFIPDETRDPIDRIVDGNKEIHETRVRPPLGLKNRFFTFEVQNINGSDLDLDSFAVDAEDLRKTR